VADRAAPVWGILRMITSISRRKVGFAEKFLLSSPAHERDFCHMASGLSREGENLLNSAPPISCSRSFVTGGGLALAVAVPLGGPGLREIRFE
jgi:hypothetical protein